MNFYHKYVYFTVLNKLELARIQTHIISHFMYIFLKVNDFYALKVYFIYFWNFIIINILLFSLNCLECIEKKTIQYITII